MIINKTEKEGQIVPDLPEGLEYKSIKLNPDGETYTVSFTQHQKEYLYADKAQVKIGLIREEKLEQVEQFIDQHGSIEMQVFWKEGKEFFRYSPTIQQMAEQFSIDLDDFWKEIKQIKI